MILVLFSFIFYGWWDWRFLFLIIFSGLIDYFAALAIENKAGRKKVFLLLSLIGNIGSLAVFKYSGFIADNLDLLLSGVGVRAHFRESIPDFALILPVGISFYTFQSMSYSIDVYKGKLKATHNIWHFFAYLSLFPQLVAGPIVRASKLLPMLKTYSRPHEAQIWEGTKLIISGFFFKMVLADNLAPYVNIAYSHTQLNPSALFWWYINTLFAFQIFYDFAGYSRIARGLMNWIGYPIEINFNHPYTSLSLREFWQRWHISLSSWFRDYVYIPLGGSRKGKLKAHIFMWIAMLVSGLWHGAAWNFIVWGALHALFLSLERLVHLPKSLSESNFLKPVLWFRTIVFVWIAWVFFRAESFTKATEILNIMFTGNFSLPELSFNKKFFLILALIPDLLYIINVKIKNPIKIPQVVSITAWALLAATCIFLRGPGSEFIYFQF